MLLQPFIKKLAWDLYGQDIIFQFDRINRKEPCFVALVMDIILNNFQAIFPHLRTSPFHAKTPVPLLIKKFVNSYIPVENQETISWQGS